MKIELKNVKHAEFASEETNCFEATVYIDGVKAGVASNEGHGGPTSFHPYALQEKLDAYGKTLPKAKGGFIDSSTEKEFEYQPDAESIVGDLLTKWLMEKDLKKMLKKKIVFTKANAKGIYTTKAMDPHSLAVMTEKSVREKLKDADKILNFVPFEKAFEIYESKGAD